MLRLRTTVVLSSLAMAVCIAGTDWLSQRSSDEPLAMPLVASVKRPTLHRHRPAMTAVHAHVVESKTSRSHRTRILSVPQSHHDEPALSPELVPLDMPASRDVAYDELRDHLDGRVLIHVTVDGRGHVTEANVVDSSGDAVLDAHALRSVRGWRFAVPPDHPDGLSADLPMRFSSHEDPLASVP